MTACVDNKEKKGGAAKAVSATLAGVLAVGMVPAVALAADEAPEEEAGIDLLAEDAATAFSNGTVSYKIGEIDYTSADDAEIEWTGNGLEATNVEVTPLGGAQIDVANPGAGDSADNYSVYFVKADAEGEPTTEKVAEPTEAGNYFLAVEAVGGNYEGGTIYAEVNITGKAFTALEAYDADADEDTVVAGEFTYTAEAQNIEFTVTPAGGEETELVAGKDYTVKYYASGEDYNNPAAGSETAPTNQGTYTARLTGIGAYAGQIATKSITIKPFEVTADKVYVEQVVGATTMMPTQPTTVGGSEALAAELKLTYDGMVGDLGPETATVATVEKDDKNFTIAEGTTVTVTKVARAASITYDGAAFPEELTINLGAKEKYDADLIEVMDGTTEITQTATETAPAYKVTYKDADGELLGDGTVAPTAAGTYFVEVEVVPLADGENAYQVGGSAQMKLVIIDGIIDCDTNLFVNYEGKIVTSVEADYTGDPIAITTTLYKDAKRTEALTVGADYKVVYKNADGEEVDSIVDAGTYTMEITSDDYTIKNGTVDIVVNPFTVTAIRIPTTADDTTAQGTPLEIVNGRYGFISTGEKIAPAIEYATGERNTDGSLKWFAYTEATANAVDTNSDITFTLNGEEVKEVKEIGDYTMAIAAAEVDSAKNYEFTAEPFEFTVAKGLDFVDVPTTEWYYEYVQAVSTAPAAYMGGYSDGKFFGPNDAIKRGDVCMVLARMAGVQLQADGYYGAGSDEGSDEIQSFPTPFSDVNSSMYYAQAIAWAADMGIVTGDDGTTNFRPEDSISRQEFATVLYRYAEKAGTDVSADVEAELAKYTDGDLVADFADEAVAWLSSEGIMTGHAGTTVMDPTAPVTRAQVAKMTVEYQPARLG